MSQWRSVQVEDERVKEFNLAEAVRDDLAIKDGGELPGDVVLAMTIKWLHNEVMALRGDFDRTRYAEGDILLEALREDNRRLDREVRSLRERLAKLEGAANPGPLAR